MAIFLYLLFSILGLVLLFFYLKGLVEKYNENENNSINKRSVLKIAIALGLLFLIPFLLHNFFSYEPDLSSTKKKIQFHSKYRNYMDLNRVYHDTLWQDQLNVELNMAYVSTLADYIKKRNEHGSYDAKKLIGTYTSNRTDEFYRKFINSEDSEKRDLGRLYLALHWVHLENYPSAYELLDSVEYRNSELYSFVKGSYLSRTKIRSNYTFADSLLNHALGSELTEKQSYNELARLYYYYGKEEELETMVTDPLVTDKFNFFIKRIVFMRDLDIWKYWELVFTKKFSKISLLGFISAFLILLLWLFYFRQIDVYEQEKWKYIVLTLVLSSITIFLVYPISDFLWDYLHLYPSIDSVKGFFQMFISIGIVEEGVKILPVLFLLYFTNAINEPYDYILYCSVSALGFAFVENLSYLQESSLYNINARAMMAAFGHIVFSATVGYGMMLAKYKKFGRPWVVFILFFLAAALMHAFYDFWLIHDAAEGFEWVSTIFILFSIHLWFIFANNSINISNFYQPNIRINNDKIRSYLILSLLGVMILSYVINGFTRGFDFGIYFLYRSLFLYGFLLLYLSFSLSKFNIVRGYTAQFSFKGLIPAIKTYPDYSGREVVINASKNFPFIPGFEKLKWQLPIKTTLERRVVIDDNLECYLANLDKEIMVDGYLSNKIIIMPKSEDERLNEKGRTIVHFILIHSNETLNNAVLTLGDFGFAGWAISSIVPKKSD